LSLAKAHAKRVDAPKTGDVVVVDKQIKKTIQTLGTPQFIACQQVPTSELMEIDDVPAQNLPEKAPKKANVSQEEPLLVKKTEEPPVVGSLYKSTGLLGRLFDKLWDILKQVEKEQIQMDYVGMSFPIKNFYSKIWIWFALAESDSEAMPLSKNNCTTLELLKFSRMRTSKTKPRR
jgi:hypothetical protein